MLLGAELQITNMFGNTFLHSFDNDPLFAGSFIVEHASVMMSISQISETLFILTIPFFLSRYGIKNVMLISIAALGCCASVCSPMATQARSAPCCWFCR